MITCLFSGGVAAFGLHLLSLCAAQAPHRRASFFAVAEMTFPRAAVFFDAAIAIKCFGVSIRYVDPKVLVTVRALTYAVQLSYHCQIAYAERCRCAISRSYISRH